MKRDPACTRQMGCGCPRCSAAREEYEGRIARAVAEAPPLPDDVVRRLRQILNPEAGGTR